MRAGTHKRQMCKISAHYSEQSTKYDLFHVSLSTIRDFINMNQSNMCSSTPSNLKFSTRRRGPFQTSTVHLRIKRRGERTKHMERKPPLSYVRGGAADYQLHTHICHCQRHTRMYRISVSALIRATKQVHRCVNHALSVMCFNVECAWDSRTCV